MSKIHLQVDSGISARLDKYLTQHLTGHSRTKIQNYIKANRVTVNGRSAKSSLRLEGGETILVDIIEVSDLPETAEPQDLNINIIYEDESLAVINKPAGMVVHPGHGNQDNTLVNGLAYHFQALSDLNGPLRPGIVHRLDKNTSGAIVVAKSNSAHFDLAQQFEQRQVKKTYLGITWGQVKDSEGKIEIGIRRQRSDPTRFEASAEGKPAVTDYKVLEQFRYLNYMQFRPLTGRTHQIRVHSAYSGFAIFADEVYNGGVSRIKGYMPEVRKILKKLMDDIGRHALHAFQIQFVHPTTGKPVQFDAPLPTDMTDLLSNLKVFYD